MSCRRIILAAFASLFAALPARALIQPLKLNFQGKLINPATNNPQTGPVNLLLKIYNDPNPADTNFLYSETQSNVPLTNGVFSIQIGTNSALFRELFLGASAYLGVTVTLPVDPGGEMVPRQQLVMTPYAFTANQLSDLNEVRLIAGPTYSTFTSAGNLIVPAGIVVSSVSVTNGITASSITLTAVGGSQFSLTTSSGINMSAGTLDVTGTSGIRADNTGMTISTIDLVGLGADPLGNPGYLYYNTSTGAIKVFDGSNQWAYVFGQSLSRASYVTTTNTAAIASSKASAATILLQPVYLPGPMMVNQMVIDVTTAFGTAGDIGVYNSTGGLVLNGGSGSLTTAAAGIRTIAPAQTGNARFLAPGQYYAAIYWNSTTGRVAGDTLAIAGLVNRVGTLATGVGTVLPATIAPGSIVNSTFLYLFEMNP